MKIQKITGTVETLEACNITNRGEIVYKYQKRQIQRFIAEYFSTIKNQIILWTTLENGQF